MTKIFFQPVLDDLGAEFGPLDNAVEKWAALSTNLLAYLPSIHAALRAHFPPESAPRRIFQEGESTFQSLLANLQSSEETAMGYLNLRFYIYLNGFLSACQESLEKHAYNEGLDPAELVIKSYYKPFFFQRADIPTGEILSMLARDLEQLRGAPHDRKGILLALRIRKGIVSTLVESYCPTHPSLYPWVQQLGSIKIQNSPEVIGDVMTMLENILQEIKRSHTKE